MLFLTASLRRQNSPNRYLSKNYFIIIKVKNSYDGNKNNELQTTKKDKEYHGIGLKSIKRIVEKYQGEFELEFKEKEVEATALLLNV